MDDFDFEDIDFDEFESVDLDGSGKTPQRRPDVKKGGNSPVHTSSGVYSGAGISQSLHSYIDDPTFDPTMEDDEFDFDDDFDMHGDTGYTGRHAGDIGYAGKHPGNVGYEDEDLDIIGGGREPGKSRSTDSKKSTKSTKRSAGLMRRILAFAIAEVLVLTGIFSYAFIKRQYNKIQRPDIDIEAVKNPNLSIEDIQKMDEGFWTVAIFGVDSRDNSAGKGNNSDVIIVANIDRNSGEIKLVSVFRDTYLTIGDGKYNKINAAYCNGGPEQAIKALNENLDLNITQYVTFNWKAVATAVNMLGGVDVELSKAEFYYINSFITETVKGTGIASVHLEHAGMNHLDGVQAVAYARLRYMDNDYSRTERQRKIIGLCFDKVKKTDPTTLANMAGVMLEMVATNMGWQEAGEAIGMMSKLYMGDTGGFPYARGEAIIGKRGSCVIPQTLESNVAELHRQLFHEENYQCSERVKAIGAKISAESGMYTEGTFIGHVSTSGYIPETKPAAQTTPAETAESESETIETSQSSSIPDIGNMTDEERQLAIEEYLEKLGIVTEDREYAISDDGYIVYVSGQDADGLAVYKYVLGNDGKRIRIFETETETSASEAESSTEGATSSAASEPGQTGTTAATGPGASQSATESSAVETRAADTTGTSAAETSSAASPGGTTSGAAVTTAGSTSGQPYPGSTTSHTTAAYPGSSTQSTTGPGSTTAGTGSVSPGATTAASTAAATTAAVVTPGGTTASETVETVPAAP